MYKWIESSFRFASSATLYSSLHRFSFVTFKVNARVDRVSINWSNSTIFTRSHAHVHTLVRSLFFSFLFDSYTRMRLTWYELAAGRNSYNAVAFYSIYWLFKVYTVEDWPVSVVTALTANWNTRFRGNTCFDVLRITSVLLRKSLLC